MSDLADVLDELERQTTAWWRVATQWGFTDHSHTHSRRVANRAEELIEVSGVPDRLQLNLVERFVLVAAAWVHDIGMQNAGQDDRPVDVRRNHPQRTRDLLKSKEFDFKLQDALLLSAIGIVAHAHGTSFYRDVLDGTDEVQHLRGEKIRIHLLAALLLLSDELDLHNERALDYEGQPDLSPESGAHWLKHQCVSHVHLTDESSGVTINLDLAFPANLIRSDAAEVEAWIVDKLMIQMVMIDGELDAGYNGKMQMNPRVAVTRRWIDIPNKRVTANVLAVIKAENAKTRRGLERLRRRGRAGATRRAAGEAPRHRLRKHHPDCVRPVRHGILDGAGFRLAD
ncbi:HD domain-containing protein [Frondihabitans sp. 4ASC-45]|uniref:HD domain-containing protein n=1 Tax=Frondihabitans sp. 4ASC-45 TaxID=3111636 RepID=UPI003C190708